VALNHRGLCVEQITGRVSGWIPIWPKKKNRKKGKEKKEKEKKKTIYGRIFSGSLFFARLVPTFRIPFGLARWSGINTQRGGANSAPRGAEPTAGIGGSIWGRWRKKESPALAAGHFYH